MDWVCLLNKSSVVINQDLGYLYTLSGVEWVDNFRWKTTYENYYYEYYKEPIKIPCNNLDCIIVV